LKLRSFQTSLFIEIKFPVESYKISKTVDRLSHLTKRLSLLEVVLVSIFQLRRIVRNSDNVYVSNCLRSAVSENSYLLKRYIICSFNYDDTDILLINHHSFMS